MQYRSTHPSGNSSSILHTNLRRHYVQYTCISHHPLQIHNINKLIIYCTYYYRSVPGKCPWGLEYTSQFWPVWALTRDIISIRLYISCYTDPLECGTWALTREWALARDTTVYYYTCTHGYYIPFLPWIQKVQVGLHHHPHPTHAHKFGY